PVALFFRKVLNATKSHPAGPLGREVRLARRRLRAVDGVLDQPDAAPDHLLALAEVGVVRGAPGVFLVPVGRPLERPGAHPLKAQVALPAVLQELLSPRIEPAAGGIEARRPLPLHLARQAL